MQGKSFTLHTNSNSKTNTLSSPVADVEEYGKEINQIIKERNHLRGNVLFLDKENILFKETPNVLFDQAIFAEDVKQDIIDNTLFHIQNMEQSNGIILYGPPGTGKSLLCSAIMHEAKKNNISTVYSSSMPDFSGLEELIHKYLGRTIIFLEDVDSYGFSRKDANNFVLSDFLQFMNGITQREDPVIVIATTNYLEHLDDAIGKRPVRFNRKFHVDYPANPQIDEMVRYYIGKDVNPALCHDKKFSGAHIAEVRRTIDLAVKKNGTDIKSEYQQAVKLVEESFSIGIKPATGFQVGDE